MRSTTATICTVDHHISLLMAQWERYVRCLLLWHVMPICTVMYCTALHVTAQLKNYYVICLLQNKTARYRTVSSRTELRSIYAVSVQFLRFAILFLSLLSIIFVIIIITSTVHALFYIFHCFSHFNCLNAAPRIDSIDC